MSEAERIHGFFRDIRNYVSINNDIRRRDYDKPMILNPTPVSKTVFTGKFGFSSQDYIDLPEMDGTTCIPGHGEEYMPTVGSKWNNYCRVKWNPTAGDFPTIRRLIEHLYGKNSVEEDQVEEFYDYHTIMLKDPTQKLHARVLYSHQQGTSKSALAYLETLMFGDNVVKIRDTELESTFNSIWVNSLVLHLDEPHFKDKDKTSKVIRDLVTADKINLRLMQTDYRQVGVFLKLLVTTNDSDWMPITEGDRRYWVREVPMFAKEHKSNSFLEDIKAEVDYYIYFLQNRKMKYETKQGITFWHPDSILNTVGFNKVVIDNKNDIETSIVSIITEYFLTRKEHDAVYFTHKEMKAMVADDCDVRLKDIPNLEITKALRDGLKISQPTKTTRVKSGAGTLNRGLNDPKPGKYWIAHREKFDSEVDVFKKFDVNL